ncbi:MAG: radical SAM protein [Thermoplasmatota archaeon]
MGSIAAQAEEQGFRVLETTLSVDEKVMEDTGTPATIPAAYVEKEGTVYLLKENGTMERIGSIEYWNKIMQFRVSDKKVAVISTDIHRQRPMMDCGLCDCHKNTTALLNVAVTNRCDLRCWYCFFYEEKAGFIFEPTVEEILEGIRAAEKYNGYIPPVQITGGEPAMRRDLDAIIRGAVEMGSPHVQLNTNSVSVGIDYYQQPDRAIQRVNRWVQAGLKTIYTSFDGMSPDSKSDPKNHYEVPFALQAYIDGGIKSTVLVPTVSQFNLRETPDIVRFAVHNLERGIKAVNFQPLSMVGYIKKGDREKLRVVQSDIVEELQKAFGFGMEAWYPVPTVASLADIVGRRSHYDIHFYNNEKCGIATYAYVDRDRHQLLPITEFIDVDRFIKDISALDQSLLKKVAFGARLLKDRLKHETFRKALAQRLSEYIIRDELPNGELLSGMLEEIIEKGDYSTLRKFHYSFIFLGMMHFQDYYNYDVHRVERCSIHYSAGHRLIPFCTYNVFPSIHRDRFLEEHRVTGERAQRLHEESRQAKERVETFRKNIDEIVQSPIYQDIYDFGAW